MKTVVILYQLNQSIMHTTKPFMRNASLEDYYEFAIAIPVQ